MRFSLQGIRERVGLSPGEGDKLPNDAEAQEAEGKASDSECIVSKIGMPVLKASGIDKAAHLVLAEQGLTSGPIAVLKHAGDTGLRLVGIGREASPPPESGPAESAPQS